MSDKFKVKKVNEMSLSMVKERMAVLKQYKNSLHYKHLLDRMVELENAKLSKSMV